VNEITRFNLNKLNKKVISRIVFNNSLKIDKNKKITHYNNYKNKGMIT
jgi:hypothetical protein